MIEVRIRRRLGSLRLDVDISAEGRLLALCGPSGAGKTSLLNLIAGLDRPDAGRIAIGPHVFFDSERGVDTPARLRRVGYVFQEPRLFPHLSVEKNLLYGARFAEPDGADVAFGDVVEMLGVGALLTRRPEALSGGEKQRIAIGRALLMRPRALLLDEPLTAIDDARRYEILALMETLRDAFRIPMIFVSHRASEVERLANDVATIEAGRLVGLRKASLAAE